MDRVMKRKIEQLDEEEQDKLRELLRDQSRCERQNEGSTLGWMYKQDKPDSEDYLLGREIDKHIDNAADLEDQALKNTPGAIFADAIARRADLDMHAKMREDPLYAIRKKEEDARRRIIENPIKMKQLQKMVENQKQEIKQKKRKKHKKHHKKADSSDDSDNEVLNKYLAIMKNKELKQKSRTQRHDPGQEDNSKLHSHKHTSHGDVSKHSKHSYTGRKQEEPDSDFDAHRTRQIDHDLIRGSRREDLSTRRKKQRSRSRSKSRELPRRDKKEEIVPGKEVKKKLSSREMDRRRQEMMENARWRDEQRETNIAKYREEDKKEEKNSKQKDPSSSFLNPLMMKHATSSSVEDRLKRNKYNIQRTKADLDKNFTKH